MQEVKAVLDHQRELERGAYLRAGLVAATIVNVNRKPGAPMVTPEDFLRSEPSPEDYMDVDTAIRYMDRWAQMQNAVMADQGE